MNKSLIFLPILLVMLNSCEGEQQTRIPELVRKPYLQSAIADSVTILWRTDSASSAQVAYRISAASDWTEVQGVTRMTNTGVYENEVVLTQLDPDTRYEYQILSNGHQLLGDQPLYFTSPVDAEDTVFSFFAVGDIGEPVETEGTPDQLGRALSHYVDSLRFGLLLGDIIYPDGKSEVYDQNLFQYFGEVFPYVPVFTVLGNHDWHEPEENYMQEWKLPGNEHYYSFDQGNVHFVALDTKNGEMYDYDKQVSWLKNDLATLSGEQDWIIVFLHHNGKSCTYKHDYEGVVSLYPVFEQYGVDLVLNGHAHTYERLKPMDGQGEIAPNESSTVNEYHRPNGFMSITVGSGGKLRGIGSDPNPWSPDPDSCKYPGLVAAFMHDWAFLALDIEGNRLTGRAITTENLEVVDQFVIDKR